MERCAHHALNPMLKLPDTPVVVIHRADGSGTTGIFTTYLAAADQTWREKVGAGQLVAWPAGVGVKGNAAMAAMIRQTSGSIGYLEYTFAVQSSLTCVALRNRSGAFVHAERRVHEGGCSGRSDRRPPGNIAEPPRGDLVPHRQSDMAGVLPRSGVRRPLAGARRSGVRPASPGCLATGRHLPSHCSTAVCPTASARPPEPSLPSSRGRASRSSSSKRDSNGFLST